MMNFLLIVLIFLVLFKLDSVSKGRSCFKHDWHVDGHTDHMALVNEDGAKRFIFWKRERLRCSKCPARKKGKKIEKR